MKTSHEISVNEWNQVQSHQDTLPETWGHSSTELDSSFGVLHTPEAVPSAKGRMTDRASRILQIGQKLEP